jgi:hypothetical protein
LLSTVSVRAHDTSSSDGTSTLLGSVNGQAANTIFEINLSTSSLAVGIYTLELYANFEETDQINLNNDGEKIRLIVEELGAI